MLPSCVGSGVTFLRPATLPAELVLCFDTVVPVPDLGKMGRKEVIQLIVDLKISETEKTACGLRILAFYNH